ncbi:MAG: hypothetical protein OXG04_20495 [Acidobacteria bacterium]|nr:hypothetical protein [Acidobacteriota bacterium]
MLQTTMELQKSVGALTQAVTTLTEQVKEQGAKLDAMRHEVTAARASIKTAGWLLGGIAAVIAWLLYCRLHLAGPGKNPRVGGKGLAARCR